MICLIQFSKWSWLICIFAAPLINFEQNVLKKKKKRSLGSTGLKQHVFTLNWQGSSSSRVNRDCPPSVAKTEAARGCCWGCFRLGRQKAVTNSQHWCLLTMKGGDLSLTSTKYFLLFWHIRKDLLKINYVIYVICLICQFTVGMSNMLIHRSTLTLSSDA